MEEHQPQATTESDESADIADVKVCDICGDAGEEELLAICSRCTDGAEHTYCMRKKLDELPEGGWLCEECQPKEETEIANKSEPVRGEQVLSLNESTSNPKLLQEFDTKVHASEARGASKDVDAENDMNSSRKVSDSSEVSIGAAISKAKSILSRGSSFSFLEAGKLKQAQPAASCGGSEVKKASILSKSLGHMSSTVRGQKSYKTDGTNSVNASSTVAFNNPNTVLRRTAPRSIDSTYNDNNIKGPTFSNIPKQEASGDSRILHSKICNDMGHTSQLCSIDKLHVFAPKSSANQNLKEGHNKSSKWQDAVAGSSPRFLIQNNARLPNYSEKSSTYNAEFHCGLASKDSRFDFSSCRDIVRTSVVKPSKISAAVDVNLHAVHHTKASFSSGANDTNHTITISDSNQMKVKSPQILPNKASVLPNIVRTSVIPVLEFIWQGGFEVSRSGRLHKFCDGVQAHLSTSASPKVLEAATKIPGKVHLEEVTRASSWPWQFQGKSPQENNIGLFFFAKDFESYEKNYWELLEYMMKNDLVLKGNIEGAELLVLPSSKLPANSQRWNRLFFLWGVFMGKKSSCTETVVQFGGKPHRSILEPSFQDLPTPLSELSSDVVKCMDSAVYQPILSPDVKMNAKQLSNGATSRVNFLKNNDLVATRNVNSQSSDEMKWIESLTTGEKKGPHDSFENVRSSIELLQSSESIFPPADDTRQRKKMKIDNIGNLHLNSQDDGTSFPMDVDLVEDAKSDTISNIELGLGSKKELPKEETLLPSSSKAKDDAEASLSLSLAFCASKKE